MASIAFQLRVRMLAVSIAILVAAAFVAVPTIRAQDVQSAEETTAAVQAPDVTPPVIAVLPNLYAEAVDGSGAMVSYVMPTAQDDVDGAIVPGCSPASGSVFALGTTSVTCSAVDSAGNRTDIVAFSVTVGDTTPPTINQPADLQVSAPDQAGTQVSFDSPAAWDTVSGAVAVGCAPASGSLFPIGSTFVSCTAQDGSGNAATVSFSVTVDAPASVEPSPTATAEAPTPEPSPTVEPTATAEPTVESSPEVTPTPAALGLPWPPPPPVNPIYGSGPIDGLSMIWGGLSFPISQEYGHTLFALSQPTLYLYGTDLGLDGRAHPGLDIGMGRGTYLYSPVNGTVVAAGGTGGFGFYGNTLPGVGELRIETAEGHQVILGHMAAIAVYVGDQVTAGQFVGLSGGDNGDHLHLEARQASGGGFIAVDPRASFLIPAIAEDTPEADTSEPEEAATPAASDAEPDFLEAEPAEAGLSDGSEGAIFSPTIDEARREDDSEPGSVPDGSIFLSTLISPPAAPAEGSKRTAIEAVMGR